MEVVGGGRSLMSEVPLYCDSPSSGIPCLGGKRVVRVGCTPRDGARGESNAGPPTVDEGNSPFSGASASCAILVENLALKFRFWR